MTMITLDKAAGLLKEKDNIYILTHKSPDGDTLGSACALCSALRKLGKKANVLVDGDMPARFVYLFEDYSNMYFEPEYIVSVDVGASTLLGKSMEKYDGMIDLCIDHHATNTLQAQYSYVDPNAAAAAEIIYDLIKLLGVDADESICRGIYYGISTDTGCFCYSNTTENTHLIAAAVMPMCDWIKINQINFGIKSRAKIKLEQMVYNTIQYTENGKAALICITKEMLDETGAGDDDMESIPSIPREIEGVLMGITIKEKDEGIFRISVRTNENVDASAFCMKYGGGGHIGAAGCSVKGTLDEVKQLLLNDAEKYINEWNNSNK